MTAAKGTIVSKIGAEGYQAIGIFPGKAKGFTSSVGITFKISDGDQKDSRAASAVAVALLKAFGVLAREQEEALKPYSRLVVRNWHGTEVGEVRPSRELLELLGSIAA